MEQFIQRIRNTFRRTADRMSGRHVPIHMQSPPLEDLDSRRLRTPPVDILEDEKEVMIVADTPGAFPDNTRLHWDDRNGLSLYVRQRDVQEDDWLWGEDLGDDWYRNLSLPDYVDANEARAAVHAGVLTIQIPKRAMPAPVSIPITAS